MNTATSKIEGTLSADEIKNIVSSERLYAETIVTMFDLEITPAGEEEHEPVEGLLPVEKNISEAEYAQNVGVRDVLKMYQNVTEAHGVMWGGSVETIMENNTTISYLFRNMLANRYSENYNEHLEGIGLEALPQDVRDMYERITAAIDSKQDDYNVSNLRASVLRRMESAVYVGLFLRNLNGPDPITNFNEFAAALYRDGLNIKDGDHYVHVSINGA